MTYQHSVMVVDDTPHNLRLLIETVAQLGVETRPILDGETAMKAAILQPPDLILLDIRMPCMDGLEVCRHLKQLRTLSHIPVIFVTAELSITVTEQAHAVGGLITKPINTIQVRDLVQEILELS